MAAPLSNSFRRSWAVLYGKQNHYFQYTWLFQYNGLVYSQIQKGGYFKYCILFAQAPSIVSKFAGTFITQPLISLQKATEKLWEHFTGCGSISGRKYHLVAVEKAEFFKAVLEKKQVPVDQQLSRIRAQRIAENRKKLNSIAETIIFCGKQGIALRGRWDDSRHLEESPHASYDKILALQSPKWWQNSSCTPSICWSRPVVTGQVDQVLTWPLFLVVSHPHTKLIDYTWCTR